MPENETKPQDGEKTQPELTAKDFDSKDIDKSYADMQAAVKAGDDDGLNEAIQGLKKAIGEVLGDKPDDEPDPKDPAKKDPTEKPDPFADKLDKYKQ